MASSSKYKESFVYIYICYCETKLGTMYCSHVLIFATNKELKMEEQLRGFRPLANYTDRATRRLSETLVPTSADRGCRVVSAADPCGHILGFLDRSRYFSIK
jgi:hypothetical protein